MRRSGRSGLPATSHSAPQAAARKLAADVMRTKSDNDHGVYRPETGWIRYEYGDPGNPKDDYKGGHGLSHIAAKHPKDIPFLSEVLANGEIHKHEEPGKLYVVHGDRVVVLGSLHRGGKRTVTEFKSSNDSDYLASIKKNPLAAKPGENKGG